MRDEGSQRKERPVRCLGRRGRGGVRRRQAEQATKRQVLQTRLERRGHRAVEGQLRRTITPRVQVRHRELEARAAEVVLDPSELLGRAHRLAGEGEVEREHRLETARDAAVAHLDVDVRQGVATLAHVRQDAVESPRAILGELGREDLLARQNAQLLVLLLEVLVVAVDDLDTEGIGCLDGVETEQHFVGLRHNTPPSWG